MPPGLGDYQNAYIGNRSALRCALWLRHQVSGNGLHWRRRGTADHRRYLANSISRKCLHRRINSPRLRSPKSRGNDPTAGGAYFQIVSARDASQASTFVTPGTSTTTFAGHQAFTTTSPGSVDTVIKPGQDVYIRVLKAAPTAPTPGVYSAAEIIQFTGSRVQRPS